MLLFEFISGDFRDTLNEPLVECSW